MTTLPHGIPFTQTLQNGQSRKLFIVRPAPVQEAASRLIDKGCEFRITRLGEGIRMEIVRNGSALASRACANSPATPENVDAMIEEAYIKLQ